MARLSFFTNNTDDESPLPKPDGAAFAESATASKPRGRPKGSTNQANLSSLEIRLKEKLHEDIVAPLIIASPLAAQAMLDRTDRTVKAAMNIARKNPKVRKGLEKFIDGSDYLTIAMFPLAIGIGAAVDYGFMGATSVPAKAVGIPDIWERTYPDEVPTPARSHKRNRSTLYDRVKEPDFDPLTVQDEDFVA